MEPVRTFTGAFQVNGEGAWGTIGTPAPLVIREGGYLAVFESAQTAIACDGCEASASDVYFDRMLIRFTRCQLKEESHYYPLGLPMGDMGSAAAGFTPNRRKYQGNEYIKDVGVNWMDSNARQYDPQTGRFLSVDPLAAAGGQDMFSPYVAMANRPGTLIDPWGLQPREPNVIVLYVCLPEVIISDKIVDPGFHNYNISPSARGANWSNSWDSGRGHHGGGGGSGGGAGGAGGAAGPDGSPSGGTLAQMAKNLHLSDIMQDAFLGANRENDNGYNTNFEGKTGELDLEPIEKITEVTTVAYETTVAATVGAQKLANKLAGTASEILEGGKLAKGVSRGLGYASLVIDGADVLINSRVNASNVLDAVVTGVSFIPGFGWAIGGGYFLANIITISVTGESIGDHLNNAVGRPLYDW